MSGLSNAQAAQNGNEQGPATGDNGTGTHATANQHARIASTSCETLASGAGRGETQDSSQVPGAAQAASPGTPLLQGRNTEGRFAGDSHQDFTGPEVRQGSKRRANSDLEKAMSKRLNDPYSMSNESGRREVFEQLSGGLVVTSDSNTSQDVAGAEASNTVLEPILLTVKPELIERLSDGSREDWEEYNLNIVLARCKEPSRAEIVFQFPTIDIALRMLRKIGPNCRHNIKSVILHIRPRDTEVDIAEVCHLVGESYHLDDFDIRLHGRVLSTQQLTGAAITLFPTLEKFKGLRHVAISGDGYSQSDLSALESRLNWVMCEPKDCNHPNDQPAYRTLNFRRTSALSGSTLSGLFPVQRLREWLQSEGEFGALYGASRGSMGRHIARMETRMVNNQEYPIRLLVPVMAHINPGYNEVKSPSAHHPGRSG